MKRFSILALCMILFIASCASPQPDCAAVDRLRIQKAYDMGRERGRYEMIMEQQNREQAEVERYRKIDSIIVKIDTFSPIKIDHIKKKEVQP